MLKAKLQKLQRENHGGNTPKRCYLIEGIVKTKKCQNLSNSRESTPYYQGSYAINMRKGTPVDQRYPWTRGSRCQFLRKFTFKWSLQHQLSLAMNMLANLRDTSNDNNGWSIWHAKSVENQCISWQKRPCWSGALLNLSHLMKFSTTAFYKALAQLSLSVTINPAARPQDLSSNQRQRSSRRHLTVKAKGRISRNWLSVKEKCPCWEKAPIFLGSQMSASLVTSSMTSISINLNDTVSEDNK